MTPKLRGGGVRPNAPTLVEIFFLFAASLRTENNDSMGERFPFFLRFRVLELWLKYNILNSVSMAVSPVSEPIMTIIYLSFDGVLKKSWKFSVKKVLLYKLTKKNHFYLWKQ